MTGPANAAVDRALAALRGGDLATARAEAEAATRADPGLPRAWAALGTVRLMTGDADGAVAALTEAAGLDECFAEARLNLAHALIATGSLDAAWHAVIEAARLDPGLALGPAVAKLADACRQAWRTEPTPDNGRRLAAVLAAGGAVDEAIALVRGWAGENPADSDPWVTLGDLLMRAGRFDEAVDAAAQAHARDPSDPAPLVNAAGIMMIAKRPAEAERRARGAVAAFPGSARANTMLGRLLLDQNRTAEAYPFVQAGADAADADATAVARAWYEAANLANFDRTDALLTKLRPLLAAGDPCNPFFPLLMAVEPGVIKRNAETHARRQWPKRRPLAGPPTPKDRLRIGYLSPDYRPHATWNLVADLFRHHDRSAFDIRLYGLGREDTSGVVAEANRISNGYRHLEAFDDFAAAQAIRADNIDILVDLGGHTKDNRLGIASFRPAPLQIHYLGCPGTTGTGFIDYFVADSITAPLGAEANFTEGLLRLPVCYQINSARPATAAADRAEFGFAPDDVIYCSFNGTRKLSRRTFALWCRILAGVEHGLLWLLADDEGTFTNLQAEAARNGIDPNRLRAAPRLAHGGHLRRLGIADIHLDSAPYNAHTTGSDALWMGCVLLAVPGDTFAARVSASLLTTAGLTGLICASEAEMVQRAIGLGRDPAALAEAKAGVRAARSSPLFDPLIFTRAFEAALRGAWTRAAGS